MSEYDDLKQYIEKELYTAIEALDDNDLPFARSSVDRAKSGILEAWRHKNASKPERYINLADAD